jgi:protein ImuB
MFACIYAPNFSDDTQALLFACAATFSPRVENTASGTVVFDVEGLERLFGSYSEIAEQVSKQARTQGLQANVAIASNPDAAICAARGFPGISVVSRGTEAKRFSSLPLSLLPVSPEVIETLERWGIRTFGAFAKLLPVEVSERFGQDGVRLHKLARGAWIRPLDPHKEVLQFIEIVELDYEIGTIEPLTFILSRLLDQICSRLRSLNLATHEVRLTLDSFQRVLRLPLPVRNARLLTKLLILDLEAHPPGMAVKQIGIEAIPSKPRVVQNGLFVPLSPEPEKLELTLARIAAVVGEENVGSPEILDTHRPDVFRLRKFGVNEGNRKHAGPVVAGFSPRSLSLRILRPPLEATVQLKNSSPSWIAFHGMHGRIETASGPWRTSGDWWRPTTWDREEWDIEVLDTLYRIYYDVHLDRWYVHGVYD